jgi:hypothetical protein
LSARRLLLGSLLLGGVLLSPAPGAAATWTVTVEVTVGGTPVTAEFEVELERPGDAKTVLVSGVPVTASAFEPTWRLAARLEGPVPPGCPADTVLLSVSGQGTIQPAAVGSQASGPLTGQRVTGCTSGVTAALITGTFTARTDTVIPAPASVGFTTGTATLRTTEGSAPLQAGTALATGGLVDTGPDGGAGIDFPDGSRVSVGTNTQMILSPPSDPAGAEIAIRHFRGLLNHNVTPATAAVADRYRVTTPGVTVRARGTVFSTLQAQSGEIASTTVTVSSGVVEVLDRAGQLLATLSGGQQQVFELTAVRCTPILPVSGGPVTAGATNLFVWTQVPGSSGYLLEFTFDVAGFTRRNPTAPEATSGTLVLLPGAFTVTGGLVEVPLPVSAAVGSAGSRASWRVFPLAPDGSVLPGATGSDASLVILQ